MMTTTMTVIQLEYFSVSPITVSFITLQLLLIAVSVSPETSVWDTGLSMVVVSVAAGCRMQIHFDKGLQAPPHSIPQNYLKNPAEKQE